MSVFLSIIFGIPIGFILLFLILRYFNMIINTSFVVLAILLLITIFVIVYWVISAWYNYTMNENFKDGVGGLICIIFIALSVWHSYYNSYSFLTLKKYEIEKPYVLAWIEGIIIMLIGGTITTLILAMW